MKKIRIKPVLLLILAAMILTSGIGGTMAYIVTSDGPVENVFGPAYVTSEVYEPTWEDGMLTKENVKIQNTGNIDANIRAAIIVTWKDADGNTMPQKPVEGTDYTLEIGDNWTLNGSYYYYNATVAPNGYTTDLIVKCESKDVNYGDGRVLCVEVIGSAIQQQPTGGTTWAVPTASN